MDMTKYDKLEIWIGALACAAAIGCGSEDAGGTAAGGTGGAAGSGGAAGHHASGGAGGASGGGGMAGGGGGAGASGMAGAGGAPPAGHTFALVPPTQATVGKSAVALRVEDASGAPATGLASSLRLSPAMNMGMHAHGAPVPADAVAESGTAGTYDVTLFFPMDSSMGTWSLGVSVVGEASGALPLDVAAAPGTDTTHVPLTNGADSVKSPMGLDKPRNWFLFRDVAVAESGGLTFGVFVATVQADAMVWPPATVGLKLVDASGAEQLVVSSVEVSGSADGATWVPMPCDATARCGAHFAGAGSGTSELRVRLSINGTPYTTDGAAPEPSGTNGWASFSVTPD